MRIRKFSVNVAVLALVLGSIMVSSCRSSDSYNHHVAVMDSLQISLDDAVMDYEKWNLDSLETTKMEMDKMLSELTSLLKAGKDTISREQGIFLGDYKSAGNVFKNVKSNDARLNNEITMSNDQLASLKLDIKNNAISNADSLNSYISAEKKAVNKLIKSLEKSSNRYQFGMTRYQEMRPKVVELLNSLKK